MSCNNVCTSQGLAILPLRYAVVPDYFPSVLPADAESPAVTGVRLANGEKYVLRALRQGYLYLFFDKGAGGNADWQCYSVAEDGSLWLQFSPERPEAIREPDCRSGSHNPLNVTFLCIPSPAACGDVWFAFSQYPWEARTLSHYGNDGRARSERMQKINPGAWLKGMRAGPGIPATEAALACIPEYQLPDVTGLLPGPDGHIPHVSRAPTLSAIPSEATDGWRVNSDIIRMQSTLYPWARARGGQGRATVERMQARSGEQPGSVPLLLPLWDAVGITHELNGWCMEAAGRQTQFEEERQLELGTRLNLEMLETTLGNMTAARGERVLGRMAEGGDALLTEPYLETRLRNLERIYQNKPAVLEQIREDNRLLESWRGQNVSSDAVRALLDSPPEPLAPHRRRVAVIREQVERQRAERPQNLADNCARDWAPYKKYLSQARQESFSACCEQLRREVDALYQARVASVVSWLQAPLLLATLDDFCCGVPRAGMFYQSAVTMCLHGINQSAKGSDLLARWLREYNTLSRGNLFWRHIAAADPEVMAGLMPLLTAVKAREDEEVTAAASDATVAWIMAQAGVLKKLTGYYSNATKSQAKALRENASALEQRLYRSDAFIMTTGDSITRRIGVSAAGETLATTMFRVVLHVRAGIPLETAEAVVKNYLRGAPEMRARVLAGFSSAQRFMSPRADVMQRRQAMQHGLDNWLASEEGQPKMKEVKIAALLLVLNALDFVWLCSQLRDDKKPLSGVVASGMAVVTQTLALVTPALEEGIKAGTATLAVIKGMGATAGMISSGMSLYTDGLAISSELEKQRSLLAGVMFMKGTVDLLSTVKYTGTLLDVLGKSSAAENIAAFLEKKILGIRILAVLMTWQVQVGILLLQVVTTLIEDNDLQVWCRQCVFGITPTDKSWNEQRKALESAFREIL